MSHAFATAFIPLFVAIDAPGFVPLFLALTDGMNPQQRRTITFEAILFALAITLAFVYLGNETFHFLGISEADFRVAGGAILLVLTVIELFKTNESSPAMKKNIGVFPLAIPLMAGPATLTTALVLAGRQDCGYLLTSASVIVNFVILLLVLLASTQICRFVGVGVLQAFSKVVMVLLAAIAINLLRTGILQMHNDWITSKS